MQAGLRSAVTRQWSARARSIGRYSPPKLPPPACPETSDRIFWMFYMSNQRASHVFVVFDACFLLKLQDSYKQNWSLREHLILTTIQQVNLMCVCHTLKLICVPRCKTKMHLLLYRCPLFHSTLWFKTGFMCITTQVQCEVLKILFASQTSSH